MTVNDIYSFLNDFAPFDTACDFDNAGLLIGEKDAEVDKCIVALDCTEAVVDEAIQKGAQLIITHHPVIFSGLKSVLADSLVYRLIENNISVISAHTNLDIADGGVNDCLAKALGLKEIKKIVCDDGFSFKCGQLNDDISPESFAKYVGEKLNFSPRFTVGKKKIKTVAVCGGSGGDLFPTAIKNGCDALVTADVKHNFFIDAAAQGFTLIDCGHFNTEDVVIEPLKELLSEKFGDVQFFTNHTSYIHCL
ncbi:MAG: Nif3-like dinuclear metal center hexameric protein [Clostridia bacterium]|nr:Nif3-like dinuclear metal center hexameric protein [Clostridia bacterium]